jgi:hypothetical protein
MKKTIELETFQGHIVLYCKGHYKYDDFFEGLKRIWAIRCGYDYELTSTDTLSYIAMDMYDILKKAQAKRMDYVMEQLHRNLVTNRFNETKNFTPIQSVIWEYRRHISDMQIKEVDKEKRRYYWLVKLPTPKKRVFNRILSGKGVYQDYYLIKNDNNK